MKIIQEWAAGHSWNISQAKDRALLTDIVTKRIDDVKNFYKSKKNYLEKGLDSLIDKYFN